MIIISYIVTVLVSAVIAYLIVDYIMRKRVTSYVDRCLDLLFIQEIEPIREVLLSYPPVIKEIHLDLEKILRDIDLLNSNGQSGYSPPKNLARIQKK